MLICILFPGFVLYCLHVQVLWMHVFWLSLISNIVHADVNVTHLLRLESKYFFVFLFPT
uniref:Uncharacterized protein n=1 Tax=Anguilla anguilla TaxID=7936 RepID=A0A0E9XX05_ANGAN